MRTYSLFTRFFVAVVFTTITSLAIAGFSAKKAYDADPEIITKIENKYNIYISIAGISSKNRLFNKTSKEATTNQWELILPKKKLIIKTLAGDISMKSTTDDKVKVLASGHLDKNLSDKLLKVIESGDEITISEPDEAVKDLEVRLEIPTAYVQGLEVTSGSGDIAMENLVLSASEVRTASGEITLHQIKVPELTIHAVSGNTRIHDSSIKSFSGKSVSGEIELENKDSADTHIKSISGDIRLKLPKTIPFKFNLKTTSGQVKNEHESERNDSAKLSVEISTTSGDISIQ